MNKEELFRIEITSNEKTKKILKNVIQMLYDRQVLDKQKLMEHYEKLISSINDEFLFNIKSDFNDDLYIIKFVHYKLTTIKKITEIENILYNSYQHDHKIFIVNDIVKKAYDQFLEFKNTEVFLEKELIINILDNILQPKFEILTKNERKQLIEEYQLLKKQLPRMLESDPVARYFNLKPGDMVRIIRQSITTCDSIYYRIIIKAGFNL